MSDLTDFLLARIAGDEAVARAASPGPWTVDDESYAEAIHGPDGASPVAGGRWGGEASVFDSTEDALHIARWDPARVLAECEAKRRLVHGLVKYMEEDYAPWNEDFLHLLALPYASRPDYRQEWKP